MGAMTHLKLYVSIKFHANENYQPKWSIASNDIKPSWNTAIATVLRDEEHPTRRLSRLVILANPEKKKHTMVAILVEGAGSRSENRGAVNQVTVRRWRRRGQTRQKEDGCGDLPMHKEIESSSLT